MLLNATHEVTCAGLPPHIQERYVRYKQGNRAIVGWMTKFGPDKYKGKKTLPIKQLIALGKFLCNKVDEIGTLPSDIDYYFNEVIKDRTFLSTHFRAHRDQCEKDKIDTVNHEHFNESLKQIHSILLTAGKPSERGPVRKIHHPGSRHRSSISSATEVRNTFNHLVLTDSSCDQSPNDSDDEALTDPDTDATSDGSHSRAVSNACLHRDDDAAQVVDFLNNEVDVAVDALLLLDKVGLLGEAIKSCWIKAGRHESPVPSCAAYTNVLLARALSHVRTFEASVATSLNPSEIKQRLNCLARDNDYEPEHESPAAFDVLESLCEVEASMDRIFSRNSHQLVEQSSLLNSLITDSQDILTSYISSTLTLDGLTPMNCLRQSFNKTSKSPPILASAIMCHLTSVSHCAYCSTVAKPPQIALPRISALKMANDALASIKAFIDDKNIFPCQCINTLAYRVTQMKEELEAFARYKCWNTVIQTPLIAGNHVIEILDLCSYYGMHLFHYRQYVAGVLYSYQALVRLGYLDSITILEEVCDLFAPALYTTRTRPEFGFMASWLRYIGARLKFKEGEKHRNHRQTWCMSVPARVAARSAGLGIGCKDDKATRQAKFDFGTIDPLMRMKHDEWNLSVEGAESLERDLASCFGKCKYLPQGLSSSDKAGQSILETVNRTLYPRRMSCHASKDLSISAKGDFLNLHQVFDAGFKVNSSDGHNLPISRFNLLAFFHSMTKVVAGVSDATHEKDSIGGDTVSKDDGRGQMCLCFVQTILRGADRIQDVRKRRGIDAPGGTWSKSERECIECFMGHLMKTLQEAKVQDGQGGAWLWSSI